MKLVRVSVIMTFIILLGFSIVVLWQLPEITNSIHLRMNRGGSGGRDFFGYDYGYGYDTMDFSYGPFQHIGRRAATPFITSGGSPTALLWSLVTLVLTTLTLIFTIPPMTRITSIEKNRTNKRGLFIGYGVIFLLTCLLFIPGILMIIGASTGEKINSEVHLKDDDIYSRDGKGDYPDNGDHEVDLNYRIHQVESDLKELKRRQREANYDVDDELDYMNKRNNKKFKDIEDDIDDILGGRRRR